MNYLRFYPAPWQDRNVAGSVDMGLGFMVLVQK